MTRTKSKPTAQCFVAGEYLLPELHARGWTNKKFSDISGLSRRTINQILWGEIPITKEIAEKIGSALGTSSELWINLDKAYRSWKTQ